MLPDVNQINVFGSLYYASTLSNHRTKLDVRERKSFFLGYDVRYKGSLLLDIYSNEIFISRNVTHDEHIFPYQIHSTSATQNWEYFSDLTH